ncbi:MAG TPA: penicillin-binding protein 2 [Terriglobia bacterium]|nr:penicillin-binding protein 2 [Terriglobia bacterium]
MVVRFPEDQRPPAWKIAFFQYVIVSTFVALLIGYWRLQIAEHRYYQQQAERNRIRDLPVIAPRGRILDREGRVLVDNFPAFSVLLLREDLPKLTPDRIRGIAQGLEIDPGDIQQLLDKTAQLPKFQPVMLKPDATPADIAYVESHRVEYPELELLQVEQRFYLKHEFAASLLGYVGEVSEDMIAKSGDRYRPGDVAGKSGIEREYNDVLSGRDGMRRVVVNSRGQEMGSMTTINALPGNDLRLTIDFNLQMAAETALGDRSGAVVAIDPNTGEVLALASHPSFDPNDFAHHINRKEWSQLNTDPERPLLDKAIQAHLAPGSVFKIVTATAGLETGTITPSFTIICPGYVTLYGHTFHDWIWKKHRGHGSVDLHRAIVESCDTYFYTLGKMLGIDKLAYFANHLGLGSRTGIDLPAEDPGLVPTPAWVQKVFKHKWYAGETISVAIGQGAVAVTPVQLAYMIGGVAQGGVFHRPHLVFRDELEALGQDPPGGRLVKFPLSPETVAAVTSGMWGVVNEGGGTGAGARIAGLAVAGKTGTAQVVSVALKNSAHNADYKNNAWFVGYAPASNPQIVVTALVMHGGESSVASPVAGAVIKAFFAEKQSGQTPASHWQTQASLAPVVGGHLEPQSAKSVEGPR